MTEELFWVPKEPFSEQFLIEPFCFSSVMKILMKNLLPNGGVHGCPILIPLFWAVIHPWSRLNSNGFSS